MRHSRLPLCARFFAALLAVIIGWPAAPAFTLPPAFALRVGQESAGLEELRRRIPPAADAEKALAEFLSELPELAVPIFNRPTRHHQQRSYQGRWEPLAGLLASQVQSILRPPNGAQPNGAGGDNGLRRMPRDTAQRWQKKLGGFKRTQGPIIIRDDGKVSQIIGTVKNNGEFRLLDLADPPPTLDGVLTVSHQTDLGNHYVALTASLRESFGAGMEEEDESPNLSEMDWADIETRRRHFGLSTPRHGRQEALAAFLQAADYSPQGGPDENQRRIVGALWNDLSGWKDDPNRIALGVFSAAADAGPDLQEQFAVLIGERAKTQGWPDWIAGTKTMIDLLRYLKVRLRIPLAPQRTILKQAAGHIEEHLQNEWTDSEAHSVVAELLLMLAAAHEDEDRNQDGWQAKLYLFNAACHFIAAVLPNARSEESRAAAAQALLNNIRAVNAMLETEVLTEQSEAEIARLLLLIHRTSQALPEQFRDDEEFVRLKKWSAARADEASQLRKIFGESGLEEKPRAARVARVLETWRALGIISPISQDRPQINQIRALNDALTVATTNGGAPAVEALAALLEALTFDQNLARVDETESRRRSDSRFFDVTFYRSSGQGQRIPYRAFIHVEKSPPRLVVELSSGTDRAPQGKWRYAPIGNVRIGSDRVETRPHLDVQLGNGDRAARHSLLAAIWPDAEAMLVTLTAFESRILNLRLDRWKGAGTVIAALAASNEGITIQDVRELNRASQVHREFGGWRTPSSRRFLNRLLLWLNHGAEPKLFRVPATLNQQDRV
ncbi:MAG: hypothetical protein HY594_00515, partial [Candidatus Omnitrophica bacterium]|nr:hypothetical protein [Candidatus Omnitrophota bacterium]